MTRPRPTTVPMATRIAGVMKLFSKEYFTRKTIPRKRTNPPIQAKSFTPKNASQSKGFGGGGGTGGGICGGRGGGGSRGGAHRGAREPGRFDPRLEDTWTRPWERRGASRG